MLNLNRRNKINHHLKQKININNLVRIFFVTTILTLVTFNNANANMFNRFKKGFYFEKYDNAQEAKYALLKLHPIDSEVGELVKTLEKAGGKCGIYREEMESYEYTSSVSGEKGIGKKSIIKKIDIISEPALDYHSCYYKVYGLQTMFFCTIDWSVNIKVSPEDKNKIFAVEVYRNNSCL